MSVPEFPFHAFNLHDQVWESDPRFPSIRFKLIESKRNHPHLSCVLVELAVGGVIETHTHPIETETAYVLAGEGVFWVGTAEIHATVGMGVTIPPTHPHGLRNTGAQPMLLLAIHAPGTR
ncbi:MAG: hypothetical protein OHK0023_07980 [Anaerolineae bacterium]